jgi:hypothetical protein
MGKKLKRNRFRDMLGDYYLTNRQITKEADAQYQREKEAGERQPWNRREWAMLLVTLVVLILIILKYLAF